MPLSRRALVKTMGIASVGGAGLAALGLAPFLRAGPVSAATAEPSWQLSDAQWRARLNPAAYQVLRRAGTEAQFTSPLLREHHKGVFTCAGCALPLFSSTTKYDSGTGWPSFWQPLPGAIATRIDHDLIEERTEVHCRRCAGHLGHVFTDGPRPTGLRYCMNGVALGFKVSA